MMSGKDKVWCEERGEIVVVHASDSESGISAEYDYLRAIHGEQDRDWRFVKQRLEKLASGGWADVVEIALAEGGHREFRFDISAFFSLGGGGKKDSQEDDVDPPAIGESIPRKV